MWDKNVTAYLDLEWRRVNELVLQLKTQRETVRRFELWIKVDEDALTARRQELETVQRSLYSTAERLAELETDVSRLQMSVSSSTRIPS